MRLLERNDTSLAIALVAGTVVIFDRPLRLFFETARDIEARFNVDLIPGLAVLLTTFAFHQYKKRQQSRRDAAASAAAIAHERQRSAELERLVAFGAALSAAVDLKGIKQVFWRFMPAFARGRDVWIAIKEDDNWDLIVRDESRESRDPEILEQLATSALEWPAQAEAIAVGVLLDDDMCFPLAGSEAPLGVVGVRSGPPLLAAERRALGAAVALLTSAMRSVTLLAQTRENSLRDHLTGCFNRAYALETLASELHRARRSGRPLSVMMFDVDRFKRTNDEFGHLAGDAILAAVAGQCSRSLRASDIKCRWGGDEFLMILPDTPLAGAEHAGGALTRDVAALRVPTAGSVASPTISLGVAVAEPGEDDPLSLIARADAALYRAKQTGRNRFVVAQTGIRIAS